MNFKSSCSLLLSTLGLLALFACGKKGTNEVEVPQMVIDMTTAEGPAAYVKCVQEKPGDWGEGDEENWPKECDMYTTGRYGNFE